MVVGGGPLGDFWIRNLTPRCGGSLGLNPGEKLEVGTVETPAPAQGAPGPGRDTLPGRNLSIRAIRGSKMICRQGVFPWRAARRIYLQTVKHAMRNTVQPNGTSSTSSTFAPSSGVTGLP